jgi:DNA-binding FrmR family transcriptional regulator
MAITNESRDKLKARLSKAIGHLNAVYKMVDEQKYCIDILNQLKAVQSALDKSAEIMLKDHLNTCVVEAVQNNDSARVMEELWQLLRHSNDAEGPEQSLETSTIKAATKTDCCGS